MNKVSDKNGVQQFLNRAKIHGLKHVVISPGSRNAPLSISFAQDKDYSCYVIPDERSAGFYALGMAQQLNEPVALVCTSGSALLNYYPAISESFYRNIPLIVVSADRPAAWIDQGDGQTIRQEGVFSNHIIDEVSLLEITNTPNEQWFNERNIDRLFNRSKALNGGPIHFNFPFSEPLYLTNPAKDSTDTQITEQLAGKVILTDNEITNLISDWNSLDKKLIICGQLPENKRLEQALIDLTQNKSVAVLVENTSNLVYNGFIHCIDRTLNSIGEDFAKQFQPNLLITIGGAVISKRIKAFLRKNKPNQHWKIGSQFPFMDTYQSLTKTIPLEPEIFLHELLKNDINTSISRYGEQWKQLDYLIQNKHFHFFEGVPYSDLSVFHLLMDSIPENSVLHLANSSVVRYSQLFDPLKSIDYNCNRGTSGIDGSTSTAMGASIVDSNNLHTFISGDISFFYDSNAFWNKHLPSNFRMFIINNGGGGIFKIIPGPDKTEELDDFFVAKQSYAAANICKAFDINYKSAKSVEEINEQLDGFYAHQENNRPVVMEIFTPHQENDKILKSYFKAVKVKPKILKPD